MKPVQHISNNDVLRPPPGATIEECKALPITRVKYNNGTPAVLSFWQPSDAELRAIAAGKPICLSALGNSHPPVWIGVDFGVEAD